MGVWFHTPALLTLLPLAALPLLLHLLARKRPPRLEFSDTKFLLQVAKARVRLKRPHDLLLLLLRTFLYLAAILLFARPVWSWGGFHGAAGGRSNLVLLLDATASMGYMEGGQTRFAAACAEAAETLSSLKSGDRANILWLRANPEAVYPEPGVNLNYLRERLRQAKVTVEAGDAQDGLKRALAQLENCEGRKTLCVISDFQRSQWGEVVWKTPRDVELMTLKVGESEASNLALSDLAFDPASPLAGEEFTALARLDDFSDAARSCQVYLNAGELRAQKLANAPAWGSASPAFRLKAKNKQQAALELSIPEDAFPPDNRRWKELAPVDSLRVSVWGDGPTAKLWLRAWGTLGWLRAVQSAPDQDADLVAVANWDGSGAPALAKLLESGKTVLIQPAPGLDVQTLATLAHERAAAAKPLDKERLSPPMRLTIDRGHRLFELFKTGQFGDPAAGNFTGRLRLDSADFPAARQVISYSDGVPALLECPGPGRLWIWNLSLAPEDGDWAKRPCFVPFMGELALRGRAQKASTAAELTPGARASRSFEPGLKVKLRSPSGRELPLAGTDTGKLSSGPLSELGVHEWSVDGKTLGWTLVNFPSVESDLRQLPNAVLKNIGVMAKAGTGAFRELREGVETWPWLLSLALLALALEGVVMLASERPTVKEEGA